MVDVSHHRGPSQFGRAYQIMLQNDAHAPGSVDRVLLERMVRLCSETAAYLYEEYTPTTIRYERGSRPELQQYVEEAVGGCASDEERMAGIAGFLIRIADRAEANDLDAMLFGGMEEEIINRGTDFCVYLTRVGCVMCQVAGFPARLVNLFNTDQAYGGHAVIEGYRGGIWGAVDTSTGVVYRHSDGRPATTWELMHQPALIEAHSGFYSTVGQFRGAAVSNYFVWDWKDYDYTVTGINDYYRSILEMSSRGWPGGLRWLHGEDKA